jgi:hypothetical protein
MSAAANVKTIATEKTKTVKPGQTFIFGKISDIEKFQTKAKETRYRTRILMKDPMDDFSYPMPFDVVSPDKVGELGEVVEVVAAARTFRKDYTTRADENGEVKKIKQVTVDFYLVD